MRFTTRNDAKDFKTLAARVAGPNASAARRKAVAQRIRELNPHVDDLETLPPDAPIVLPEDVDDSSGQTDADPRIAHALRVADEAAKAAQETIRESFKSARAKAKEREKALLRQREASNDPRVAEKIAGEIDRLRAQRATRQADVERIGGTLEKTAGRVEKLRERKRS